MASRLPRKQFQIPFKGIIPNIDQYYLPEDALATAENMVYRNGKFRVRPGLVELGNTTSKTGRCQGLIEYLHDDGSRRLVKGMVTGWLQYNVATSNWDDKSGTALTATAQDLQVFRVFVRSGLTWLLGTNGKDSPKKWDGVTATYVDMGGTPQVAKAMAIAGKHLLLGNLATDGPTAIDVSADLDFDTGWGTTQTESLNQTPGEIMLMLELNEFNTVVYKDDAIHVAQFVAQSDPFRFPLMVSNIRGPMSPQSVVTIADGSQVLLCDDGIVRRYTGGVSAPPLIVGGVDLSTAARRLVLDSIKIELKGLVSAVYNSRDDEIWFYYPENISNDNSVGIVINLRHQNVMKIRYPGDTPACSIFAFVEDGLTFDEWTTTFDNTPTAFNAFNQRTKRHIVGDGSNDKVYLNNAPTDDGSDITAHWEFGVQALSTTEREKLVTEVETFISKTGANQTATLQFQVTASGEDTSNGTNRAFQTSTGNQHLTGVREKGRFFKLRYDITTDEEISWRGADVYFREMGRRGNG